ncbi:hypothetical protein H4R33_007243, partial [Dimargaris cristalligena]
MQAIEFTQPGGPDVVVYKSVPKPDFDPAANRGQVLVKNRVAGVNFADVKVREGEYPSSVPNRLGLESSGVVEAVGADVNDIRVGDRVVGMGGGLFAEYGIVPRAYAAVLPDEISFQTGAASYVVGLTALALIRRAYPVKAGDWVLVQAGAGGVGSALVQLCHHLGARVITTTSTPAKAKLATANGADHVILYTESDWVAEVKRITENRGVDVVYDAVGQTTFRK